MDRSTGGPATVANAFIEARAAGDCDRLVELLSRQSWSAGGELTRQQFLETCPQVVDGYRPHRHQEESVDGDDVQVDGDTAVVDFVLSTGTDGHLVREDGDWKVLAEGPFRLGRTPHQTVLAYVDAYTAGDCRRLTDLVGETGPAEEGRSPDQQVDQCATWMPEADQRGEVTTDLSELDDPVGATDDVSLDVRFTVAHPVIGVYRFAEEVHLVEEELEWRLDTAADGSSGRLGAVASIDLAGSLIDEPELLGSRREMEIRDLDAAARIDEIWYEGRGSEDALRSAGFSAGVWGRFEESGVTNADVSVLQFGSADGASDYADRLAELIRTTSSYEGQEATVPGLEGAHGVVMVSSGGIERAHVVAVHERAVVLANFLDLADDEPVAPEDDDDLDRAAEIAQAQIDALSAAPGG
jgi:hypothetical protein